MSRDIRTGELAEPDEAVVEFERLPQVVKRLSARARRHIANSVSKNTIRGMRADLRVYQRAGGLLPADEFDIANFIADQRALGKKPATLERYLNSLHMWHRYMNLPSPVSRGAGGRPLRAWSWWPSWVRPLPCWDAGVGVIRCCVARRRESDPARGSVGGCRRCIGRWWPAPWGQTPDISRCTCWLTSPLVLLPAGSLNPGPQALVPLPTCTSSCSSRSRSRWRPCVPWR